MKIIQTKTFIESSSGGAAGDYETQKSIFGPKNSGPIELFREKSDSEDDIKKRWKKKQKPVKVKRPYQLDGVPGSTT